MNGVTCTLSRAGEEMGLGKTVEIAALVLSNPAPSLLSAQWTLNGRLVSRWTTATVPSCDLLLLCFVLLVSALAIMPDC